MQFDDSSKQIFLEELNKHEKKAVYFFIQQNGNSSTINVDLTDEGEIETFDEVPVVFGEGAKDALAYAKFVLTENGLSLVDLRQASNESCSCDDGSCNDGGCDCQ